MVMGELNGIDLRFLDSDEERRLTILIDQIEVYLALDKQLSQLASIFDIVFKVGKDYVKQIRVVGIQYGWIGIVVFDKLNS